MTDPFAGVRVSTVPPLIGLLPSVRFAPVRPPRPKVDPAEQRRSVRRLVREDVLVRSVLSDRTPTGRAFRAIVTEISAGGLRLFSDRAVPPGPAAIRFSSGRGSTIRFTELRRVRKIPGGYEYAGSFVSDASDSH